MVVLKSDNRNLRSPISKKYLTSCSLQKKFAYFCIVCLFVCFFFFCRRYSNIWPRVLTWRAPQLDLLRLTVYFSCGHRAGMKTPVGFGTRTIITSQSYLPQPEENICFFNSAEKGRIKTLQGLPLYLWHGEGRGEGRRECFRCNWMQT